MHERDDVRVAMERLLAAAGTAVRSEWTTVAGARLHHLEAGSGPAIVLLHGGSGGGANWFRMIGPLAGGFRVLAPDLPGFGLSDHGRVENPLGHKAADGLLDWLARQDVDDVLIAGTSFGGLVAMRLAQRSERVSRLLLLDAAGLGSGIHPSVRITAGSPFTRLLIRPSRRGTAVLFRRLLTSNVSGIPVDQQELLIDYLYASARAAGADYSTSTLRLFAGVGGQREVLGCDELRGLAQPVSIVWGGRDRLLPVADAYAAAGCLPDAALRVLPDVGHSPNWERPEAVTEALIELSSRARALPDRPLH